MVPAKEASFRSDKARDSAEKLNSQLKIFASRASFSGEWQSELDTKVYLSNADH